MNPEAPVEKRPRFGIERRDDYWAAYFEGVGFAYGTSAQAAVDRLKLMAERVIDSYAAPHIPANVPTSGAVISAAPEQDKGKRI